MGLIDQNDPIAWGAWARGQDPATYGWQNQRGIDQYSLAGLKPKLAAAGMWNPAWDEFADNPDVYNGYNTPFTGTGDSQAGGEWVAPEKQFDLDLSSLAGYTTGDQRSVGHTRLGALIGPDNQPIGDVQAYRGSNSSLRGLATVAALMAAGIGGPALSGYLGGGLVGGAAGGAAAGGGVPLVLGGDRNEIARGTVIGGLTGAASGAAGEYFAPGAGSGAPDGITYGSYGAGPEGAVGSDALVGGGGLLANPGMSVGGLDEALLAGGLTGNPALVGPAFTAGNEQTPPQNALSAERAGLDTSNGTGFEGEPLQGNYLSGGLDGPIAGPGFDFAPLSLPLAPPADPPADPPAASNPLDDFSKWAKENPESARIVAGLVGAGVSQTGGGGGGGGGSPYVDSGYRPTVERGGFLTSVDPTLNAPRSVAPRGLMTIPGSRGYDNSGLWRYGLLGNK